MVVKTAFILTSLLFGARTDNLTGGNDAPFSTALTQKTTNLAAESLALINIPQQSLTEVCPDAPLCEAPPPQCFPAPICPPPPPGTPIHDPTQNDPVMCTQNNTKKRTSHPLANPCVPKNMLGFFNNYFPNVVVLGNDSAVGQDATQWLDHLGVKHRTEKTYNKSTVPLKVWRHVDEYTVPRHFQDELMVAEAEKRSLSPAETEKLDKLRGSCACYLNHRRVILDTIDRYDKAVEKFNRLKAEPDFPEKEVQLQALQAEVNQYSSIFVFEHNGRIGAVQQDGSADLSPPVAREIEKTLKALPPNWTFVSLFNNDIAHHQARSMNQPGAKSASPSPMFYHPGLGVGAKAYAVSHRIYPELKAKFSNVTEEEATRPFKANDVELAEVANSLTDQSQHHIALCKSYTYRKKSPSFHDQAYTGSHLPSQSVDCRAKWPS